MKRGFYTHSFFAGLFAVVACHAYGADLRAIEQNPDGMFLDELAGRLGCAEAARWVALPVTGSDTFIQTLDGMKRDAMSRSGRSDRAKSWLSLSKKTLFNTEGIAGRCAAPAQRRGLADGLNSLTALTPDGVTIVALGGFGSHNGPEGTITTALQEWKSARPELFSSGRVSFARIECSFSFASDETTCARDMLTKIEAFDAASAAPGKHKYLLWGYSKGGTSALEMMRVSESLRARTLAVVNVGTPVRGSILLDKLVPGLDMLVDRANVPGLPDGVGVDTITRILSFWAGDNRASLSEVMAHFADFRAGAQSLTSAGRENYLRRNLVRGSFARADGTKIPVFQMAGIVEPSRLEALPVLTVRGGKLVPVPQSSDAVQTAQLAALIAASAHPLSDACVALEDALLPVEAARAAGLDPRFLTILRTDHIGLRLHRLPNDIKHGFPDAAVVDAALATVARRLTP
jgi:hypothetical protein